MRDGGFGAIIFFIIFDLLMIGFILNMIPFWNLEFPSRFGLLFIYTFFARFVIPLAVLFFSIVIIKGIIQD